MNWQDFNRSPFLLVIPWLIALIICLIIVGICHGQSSFEEVKELALKEGVDKEETISIRDPMGNPITLRFPYKLYRKGGIGEGGHWTFYTLKYFTSINSIVVIVYKPYYKTVVILRRDNNINWVIWEVDHSAIAWILFSISPSASDEMVGLFLRPMSVMIKDDVRIKNKWKFKMEEEYRPDLCWEE